MSNQVEKHTNGLELGFFEDGITRAPIYITHIHIRGRLTEAAQFILAITSAPVAQSPFTASRQFVTVFLQSKKATFDLRIEVVRVGGSSRIQTSVRRRDGEPRTHETGLETWAPTVSAALEQNSRVNG